MCRVHSPFEWLMISRWRTETNLGLIIINIYHPIHTSGFDHLESQSALDFIGALRSDFPGDAFIMGGDLNVDRWRVDDQRRAGLTITTVQRLVEFL
jgi:hypothetical protein